MEGRVVEHECDVDGIGGELERRFGYHQPPNRDVETAHGITRRCCARAAAALSSAMSLAGVDLGSREATLAIESLEMAMFWGNAAIARKGAESR